MMMSPTTIKLVLSCLWYRNASVSTNMFSGCRNVGCNVDCIKTNKLNMNRGHKMRLKQNRAESLGYHDRHPLSRVFLREPGSRDVKNWQWRYVIHAQMICNRNNRYLHDVPECRFVKNCPTPPRIPIPVATKIQNAIQYKDRSPDWWCLARTMTSARARGRSNRLLTAAICNTGVAVVLTRQ